MKSSKRSIDDQTQHRYGVHLPSLLKLLSFHLYSQGWKVIIRELLQNAVDAVTARIALGEAGYVPLIEIECQSTPDGVVLSVSDNGIGLAEEDIALCLGTVAFSEKLDCDDPENPFIGRFGVGLLSGFMCSDEINVITRKVGSKSGVHWVGRLQGEWGSTPVVSDLSAGARIFIRVDPLKTPELTPERVMELARHYGSLLPHRILFRNGPLEIQINEPPFWETGLSEPGMIALGQELFPKIAILGAFAFEAPELRAHGIALVHGESTSIGSSSVHRLYVRRMLVGVGIRDLAPSTMPFLTCVINSDSLQVNAAREDVMSNSGDLKTLHGAIKAALDHWIETLEISGDRPRILKFVLRHDESLLGLAEAKGDYLSLLCEHYPLESSRGMVTIRSALVRYGRVDFIRDDTDYQRIELKAVREGRCVLRANHRSASRLLGAVLRYMGNSGVCEITAEDFLAEYRDDGDSADPRRRRLRVWASEELDRERCFAEFEESEDPFVLATLHLGGQESIGRLLGFGVDEDGTLESGNKRLVFNIANPVIEELLSCPDVPDDLGRAWVRLVFQDALLGAKEIPTAAESRRHVKALQTIWKATHG